MRFMPYTDTQLLVIARDITQLRKLERLRKDFVANVSHELKNTVDSHERLFGTARRATECSTGDVNQSTARHDLAKINACRKWLSNC